jgi:hypothetical protein
MKNLVSIIAIPGLIAIISNFIWHLLNPEVIELPIELASEEKLRQKYRTAFYANMSLWAEDFE